MSAAKSGAGGLLGRRAAAASEPHAAQAARDVIERGSAVDAVVAGVLAAAAESPTVFFGPVQILVAGGGAGLVAIDGRIRQPGRGVQRPRGFLAGEAVPGAARVGVSALPAALTAVIASFGSMAMLRVAGPALAIASARSPERAALLETFARRGAQAVLEGDIATELLAAAGRAARGLLTTDDLATIRPDVVRFEERRLGTSGILTAPWAASAGVDASSTHVVAAGDGRGMLAIACYEVPADGVAVAALGMALPAFAHPVMRGQTRVTPGAVLAAPAPIALRARRGVVDLAIGVASARDAEDIVRATVASLDETTALAQALAALPAGRPIAIAKGDDVARVLASA
jgi:hypothetical protein